MDTQDAINAAAAAPHFNKAHTIIIGNEKGGCGKTTTTMHLIVALLRLGFSVGCIDLDSRQRSLTRYIENRRQTIAQEGVSLPMPKHAVVTKSPFDSTEESKKDERERFAQALSTMYGSCDFMVIDTPGNDTYLSRLAHSFADTIITPINDSFVDLDVLASVDGRTLEIIKPSIYSEIVWEQKLQRAKRDGGSIDWIVMRNRLSHLDAKNKRFMAKVTTELARRIGFRAAPGFSERVIYRELFLQGLTVLDVMETDSNVKVSMSHIAARQEVRDLLKTLNISNINQRSEKQQALEEDNTLPPAEPKPTAPVSNNAATAKSETANKSVTPSDAPVTLSQAQQQQQKATKSNDTESISAPAENKVIHKSTLPPLTQKNTPTHDSFSFSPEASANNNKASKSASKTGS